jgi:hypothetical protein
MYPQNAMLGLLVACTLMASNCVAAQTTHSTNAAALTADLQSLQTLPYSLQFTFHCRNHSGDDVACSDMYYTVCFPSGVMEVGITDSTGSTARYRTKEPQILKFYIGHREATNTCHDPDSLASGITKSESE